MTAHVKRLKREMKQAANKPRVTGRRKNRLQQQQVSTGKSMDAESEATATRNKKKAAAAKTPLRCLSDVNALQ